MDRKFSAFDLRPVDFGEEGMFLNFVRSLLARSEALARVSVEQVDDQVLGFN